MDTLIDLKRSRYYKLGLVVATGVIGFVVAPIIFTTIKGIIGVIITLGISYSFIHFAPVFADMIGNAAMRAMLAEAKRHPIPTLNREYGHRVRMFHHAKKAVENAGGHLLAFKNKIDAIRRRHPGAESELQKQYEVMKQVHDLNVDDVVQFEQAVEKFKGEIEKATLIWEATQAANEVEDAIGHTSTDVHARIKTETSIDEVQLSMGKTFARLDFRLRQKSAAKALNPPRESDITISQPEKATVR